MYVIMSAIEVKPVECTVATVALPLTAVAKIVSVAWIVVITLRVLGLHCKVSVLHGLCFCPLK